LITREGYGLIAVSYDSPETLKAFSDRQSLGYSLLSDPGSKTIDAWGLRNQGASGREAGIPHPGTFIIDRQGRVVERAFEQSYQERNTSASLLARLGTAVAPASPTEVAGGQVRVRAGVSDASAAPGEKVTLIIDATPLPKMHVYAPGQAGYIPVSVTLTPSEDFKVGVPAFPPPGTYFFAPLKETVKVYDAPFRVTTEITLSLSQAFRRRAAARETLTILGKVDYQACDDAVCYRPETLPVSWSIELRPFAR
jgi:hypothetical protein